jgi:MFS family permease
MDSGRIIHVTKKSLLSALWVVVMLNMLKADILALYIPGTLDRLATVSGKTPVARLMLGAAVLMEMSIVMVVLSHILKRAANRWCNIIVGLFTIVFIWGGMSSYPHYLFVASVETVCLLCIIGIAWGWKEGCDVFLIEKSHSGEETAM